METNLGPKWYLHIISFEFPNRFKKDGDASVNEAMPLSNDIIVDANRWLTWMPQQKVLQKH